ncbi:Rv1733c family protein [Allokutzneria albata]|uniref:Transmembrane protein n=1 Tax=Allokutzneria albata TaxID=211114 RepID=A0A1G9SKX1_ALLAB|nr:hypothetical protein [Allokutzneria albata]SDM35435.1 hypothetical protein SAMN04489726_1213 [Allokutzneria albata]
MGRVLRKLGLDRNPLRRFSDQVESAVVVLLVLCVLAAVPLALLAGTVAHERLGTSTAAYRTTAVLEHDAPSEVLTSELIVVSPGAKVPGRWIAQDGTPRHGEVLAPTGARAGTAVPVWLDAAGTPIQPPLEGAALTWMSVLVTLGVLVAVGGACGLVYGVVRAILDHGRMAMWEAEWERVERGWTHRG